MASALKPRKINFFSNILAASTSLPAAAPASQRVQQALRSAHTHATSALKRRRDDDVVEDRPAKQARRDSAVDAQIAKSRESSKQASDAAKLRAQAATRHSRTLMRENAKRIEEAKVQAAAARSREAEKKSAAPVVVSATFTYTKATDCGYPKQSISKAGAESLENGQQETRRDGAAPECDSTTKAAEQATGVSAIPSDAWLKANGLIAKLKKDLEFEREMTRSKSAQVLRLIGHNTEHKHEVRQNIASLKTDLEKKEIALEQKKAEYDLLQNEKRDQIAVRDQKIINLQKQILELNREKDDAIGQREDLKVEVKRLNDRNTYLQFSAKNAADAEFKIGNLNNDLHSKASKATEEKIQAEEERDVAQGETENAEQNAMHLKHMCRALADALSTAGADVSKVFHYLNANTDMDSEDEDDSVTRPDWRQYVALPDIVPAQASTSFQPFAPKPPGILFGKPAGSLPTPSTSFGDVSFGKPSMGSQASHDSVTPASYNELNSMERSRRELSRELQANKDQTSQLQAYMSSKEKGENPKTPPTLNQRAFEKYVKDLVTDKVVNRMDASSGEAARVYGTDGDAGMFEAPPAGPNAMTSAYVDFANAETYGPDGYPMQQDDNAYSKSVSRQNQKIHSSERDNNGKVNSKHQDTWKHDKSAGKRQGLDIHMGHNITTDHSKEELIFQNGGKKRKFEEAHDGSRSKKHDNGKHPKSNGKHRGKADNRGKGGKDNVAAESTSGAGFGSNRGGRSGRGGASFRGGRGGGRGGRGGSSDEEDTAPGADDGSADDMEVSTSDDGLDLDDGFAPDLMETNKVRLGNHLTDRTEEEFEILKKEFDREQAEALQVGANSDDDLPVEGNPYAPNVTRPMLPGNLPSRRVPGEGRSNGIRPYGAQTSNGPYLPQQRPSGAGPNPVPLIGLTQTSHGANSRDPRMNNRPQRQYAMFGNRLNAANFFGPRPLAVETPRSPVSHEDRTQQGPPRQSVPGVGKPNRGQAPSSRPQQGAPRQEVSAVGRPNRAQASSYRPQQGQPRREASGVARSHGGQVQSSRPQEALSGGAPNNRQRRPNPQQMQPRESKLDQMLTSIANEAGLGSYASERAANDQRRRDTRSRRR